MEVYEQLWQDAAAAFAQGREEVDAYLAAGANDPRRGITLLLRPSLAVQASLADFIGRLAAICPRQYFYRPEEFHVTVLSIIPGSASWRNEIRHLPACRAIIRDVLRGQPAFKIAFRGLTASPGGVMVQGFPADPVLAKIRADLRAAFAARGLGGLLDRRYKITAAHMTIMRFSQPLADRERFLALLRDYRGADFGQAQIQRLHLVWHDWYSSAKSVRLLQEYPLSPCSPPA